MTSNVKNVQYKVWAGLGWADTPVKVTLPCVTVAEANTAAEQLSQACNAEIRWNWEGEAQGHYISATYTLKLQPHRLTRAVYDYTEAVPETEDETRLLDAIFGKRKVDAGLDAAYAAGEAALTRPQWDWDAIDYTVQVCGKPDGQDEGLWGYDADGNRLDNDGNPRFSAVERAKDDLVWYNAGLADGQATLLDDLAELALENEYKRGKADSQPTSHRVTLTIPSISDGHLLSLSLRAKNLKYARTDISIAFGGFTSYRAQGGWVDDGGELVTEKVTVIETFTDKPVDFITDTLTTLAERLAVSLKQDCILWTLDNAANFVSQPEAH